jgi:hypothetical protein
MELKMAINGIAPPSAATYPLWGRTNAPDQKASTTSANPNGTTTQAPSTPTDVGGTVGALSPGVLAALVGSLAGA